MSVTTTSAKDFMLRVLANQPADATYEELLRAIALGCLVQRGLADVDAGRMMSDEEVRRRMDEWFK